MVKNGKTFGSLILQIALGAMLSVAGIWALQGGGDAGAKAIRATFNGDLGNILRMGRKLNIARTFMASLVDNNTSPSR